MTDIKTHRIKNIKIEGRAVTEQDIRHRKSKVPEIDDSLSINAELLDLMGHGINSITSELILLGEGGNKYPSETNKLELSAMLPDEGSGRQPDHASNRGMKAFQSNRSYMSDLTQQKLDFSILCEQSSAYVYVMGGFQENSENSIERFDLHTGKWEPFCSLATQRTKFCSVPLPNGNILLMGGKQVRELRYFIGIYKVSIGWV